MDSKALRCKRIVIILSLLLLFMAIPHTLEDFAVGEPGKNGIPMLFLQLVVSLLIAIQALGLYFLGSNLRRGYSTQMVVGLVWPLLAGFAQLPAIFSGEPFRSGFISLFFVFGLITVGVLLFLASLRGLLITQK